MEPDRLNNRPDARQGKARLPPEEIVRRLAEFPVEVLQAVLLILQTSQKQTGE